MNKVHHALFKAEYFYGEKILKKAEKHSIVSKIYALGISAFAALNVAWYLLYMTRHTLGALKFAIVHKTKPIAYCNTRRNFVITRTEFKRHLKALCIGSVLGFFSPKKAVRCCLPPNQSIIPPRLTKEEALRLYEMTGEMHALFEQNGIKYCITSGTQLGAVRHEGMMPHDDDVDVFVKAEDKEKVENLQAQLNARGMRLVTTPIGYQICDIRDGKADGLEQNTSTFPFIDVCVAKNYSGKITYENKYFRENYSGEYLTETEWDNLVLQKFGNLELYGSREPKNYCKRMYGKDYMKYGYTSFNHRTNKNERLVKFYLRKNDRGLCPPINVTD
jgi:hypothetical protein